MLQDAVLPFPPSTISVIQFSELTSCRTAVSILQAATTVCFCRALFGFVLLGVDRCGVFCVCTTLCSSVSAKRVL